jgi:hypothetical protein
MKTQDEIVQKFKEVQAEERFFDFRPDVLASCLDFEHAQEFLKPEVTAEDWATDAWLDEDRVRQELREYMEFAWGKVEDHRGLSANRAISKVWAMLWVLEENEALAAFDAAPFPQYGAPKLRAACEKVGLPMPETERARRMSEGLQCRKPDDPYYPCDEGCGS